MASPHATLMPRIRRRSIMGAALRPDWLRPDAGVLECLRDPPPAYPQMCLREILTVASGWPRTKER